MLAIGSMVGGELPLGDAEKVAAVLAAVKKHSDHRPRIIVEDEIGNAGFDYALTLLANWSEGFSIIRQVEYPVDDTEAEAEILQDDLWTIYQKPAGKYLRFLEDEPAATESIRITYTSPHTCSDSSCTIAVHDDDFVQMLAAAYFCDMLATYYAQSQDSTIQADSVDHKSKASEYGARARVYRKLYYDHLGIKEGQAVAASVTRDQDLPGTWGGDKLTHPGKYR
jgi:hypothetical protein